MSRREYIRQILAAGKAALFLAKMVKEHQVSRTCRYKLTTFIKRVGGNATALSILVGELRKARFRVEGRSRVHVEKDRVGEIERIGVSLIRRSGLDAEQVVQAQV